MCLTDAQIQTEIEQVVADNHLPTTGGNVYFMITPDGFGSCTGGGPSGCALGGSADGYCGYHSETSNRILYAVIPYNAVSLHCRSDNPRPNASTADPTLSTISHEQNGDDHRPGRQCLGRRRRQRSGGPMSDLVRPDRSAGEATRGGTSRSTAVTSTCRSCGATPATPASRGPSRTRCRSLRSTIPAATAWSRSPLAAPTPRGGSCRSTGASATGWPAVGRRVSHMYALPGAYRVMLRATDNWGNWAYSGRTIRLKPHVASP